LAAIFERHRAHGLDICSIQGRPATPNYTEESRTDFGETMLF